MFWAVRVILSLIWPQQCDKVQYVTPEDISSRSTKRILPSLDRYRQVGSASKKLTSHFVAVDNSCANHGSFSAISQLAQSTGRNLYDSERRYLPVCLRHELHFGCHKEVYTPVVSVICLKTKESFELRAPLSQNINQQSMPVPSAWTTKGNRVVSVIPCNRRHNKHPTFTASSKLVKEV